MAVAIPIAMSAFGASAAIGTAIGISAGVVTAAAGVIVGATKVGQKINKAASKVFGEDIVKVANLAGGIALAAGWNPAEGFLGEALGGSSSAAASATQGVLATAAEGGIGAPQDVFGQSANLLKGDDPSGFKAAMEGLSGKPAAPAAGFASQTLGAEGAAADAVGAGVKYGAGVATKDEGILKRVTDFYDKSDPKVKAALLQAGGQVVAGAAQGYARSQEIDAAEKAQLRKEQKFMSGSGSGSMFKPLKPLTIGG